MRRLFIPGKLADTVTLSGGDAHHLGYTLRARVGKRCVVVDSERQIASMEITGFTADTVTLRLVERLEADTEPPIRLTLAVCLLKSDKMEFVVQKAVELGATEIIPVQMRRSVVKLEGAKIAKRTQRWQTIAEAAAKQSRRAVVPIVREPMTMEQAIQFAAANSDVRLLPYELQEEDGSTRELMESIRSGNSVSVFIGPEGGFEPGEVELAKAAGVHPISLGKRILRTETAALVVLSWLIYLLEIS